MSKKVLCAILVAVMVMGLAIPAFAAEQDITKTDSTNITIATSTSVASVKVKIQDGASVVFNPYKQKYYGSSTSADALYNESFDGVYFTQFVTPYLKIESKTGGKLSLKVKAKATLTQGMEFSATPVSWASKAPTTKSVFAYVAFFADSSDFKLHSGDFKSKSADFAGTATKANRPNMVAFTSDGELTATPLFYFNEGSSSQEGTQKGYFRIMGDATTSPETPWSDKDRFTPNLAFTFTPVAEIKFPDGKTVPSYMISTSSEEDAKANHSAG